jgi:5-methyltetrahydrofolate--homocysteine methyltransferase
LLGMPPNLKVTLNICRGMSIQLRCREKRIAAEDSPHIRDLFHQKYRGSRYSFGYPACPNLEDQTKLFALLKPEENVGVRLTSGFLLEPEQSTSAIVVHHPGAKYFVV